MLQCYQHTVRRCGQHGTLDCRYFFYDGTDRKQSPWHHVPLYAGEAVVQSVDARPSALCYFVNEIPKGSRHKMEIAGDEARMQRLQRQLPAARAAPRLSIPGLARLAAGACLVVAGDTGPLHLADAVGAPVVALFGPTDPARNGPFGQPDSVVRFAEGDEENAFRLALEKLGSGIP